jgi:hypothetical protein
MEGLMKTQETKRNKIRLRSQYAACSTVTSLRLVAKSMHHQFLKAIFDSSLPRWVQKRHSGMPYVPT